MNKRTYLVWLSLFFNIILLVGCLYFAYRWIDTSITLAYSEACESAISKRDKTIDTIMPILETLSYGLTKEQITVILEKLRIDDSIMDIENNSILYNELEFLFQDGKLVKIEWPIEIDSYVAPE